MGLQLHSTNIEPGITVVIASGVVTRATELQSGELFLAELLKTREKDVIVDLTGVEHMDSSGVQMMYACFAAVRDAGGGLCFVGANPRVSRLFEITRLDTLLPFYTTVAAAREAITQKRKAAEEA